MKLGKEGKVIESNADGLVNMLHYEDAAGVVLAALEHPGEYKTSSPARRLVYS